LRPAKGVSIAARTRAGERLKSRAKVLEGTAFEAVEEGGGYRREARSRTWQECLRRRFGNRIWFQGTPLPWNQNILPWDAFVPWLLKPWDYVRDCPLCGKAFLTSLDFLAVTRQAEDGGCEIITTAGVCPAGSHTWPGASSPAGVGALSHAYSGRGNVSAR